MASLSLLVAGRPFVCSVQRSGGLKASSYVNNTCYLMVKDGVHQPVSDIVVAVTEEGCHYLPRTDHCLPQLGQPGVIPSGKLPPRAFPRGYAQV